MMEYPETNELLTDAIQQSRLVLDANRCWAGQDISYILYNPNVQYRVYISPPLVLSYINSVPAANPISWRSVLKSSSHLLIVFQMISFLQFQPLEHPVCASPLPICTTCPTHLMIKLIFPIIFDEEYRSWKLHIMDLSPFACFSFRLSPR